MEKISSNITNKEAVHSNTAIREGITNTPNKTQLAAMKLVAEKIFEPVREHFNVPIGISSFFRCLKLNTILGGSKTSGHMKGDSIDMDADIYGSLENSQIFLWIKDNLEFDQLIWEHGDDNNPAWVHASYKAKGNRNEILIAKKVNGKTVYTKYKSK